MRLCSSTAHVGVRTCAKTTGEVTADVEFDVGVAHQQRLGICVDSNEFNAS